MFPGCTTENPTTVQQRTLLIEIGNSSENPTTVKEILTLLVIENFTNRNGDLYTISNRELN